MGKLLGGHAVVKVLEKEGVEKAFCVPGESYLSVMDGLYKHQSIQLMSTRHESGASFMADAYAKATGEVGVCMATRGPGATNLSIGLHTAMQDSTPLVALIGQVERSFKGKEAFQEVDFTAYFSHLCKWTVEINEADRIPELLHRAFYTARSGRPGPVVVSLPHDMLEDTFEYKESTPIEFSKPIADEKTIENVLREIQKAKNPFIIAGGGVIESKAQQELEEFAEKLNLPIASAFRRFNVVSNNHKNYAGWLGFGLDSKLVDAVRASDLIIALGTRLSQVTSMDYSLIDEDAKLIQVDISEEVIGKSYQADIGVISDVKAFLKMALTHIKEKDQNEGHPEIEKLNADYIRHSTLPISKDDTDYAEMNSVIKDVISMVPENSILTSDAGNFFGWLARYFRFSHKRKYIGTTSGAMGYGLPAALGIKVASPDSTVISFSGDGGFTMTITELETAVRENINVIAIVFNNNLYGTIRAHQEKHFPGRNIGTSLTNPSFAEIAEGYGCKGATVTKNEEFLPVFKQALASDKSFIIEILTSPEMLTVSQAAKK